MPKNGETLKEKLIRGLELPEEVLLDIPTLNIYGNKKIEIYNFKGLVEYSLEKIRINTNIGMLVVEGTSMNIKNMTLDEIHILGNIMQISYRV